jgi:hypothetical protein
MTFEQTMSTLVAAIGNVERLEALTPEQYDRLKAQTYRLYDATFIHMPHVDD